MTLRQEEAWIDGWNDLYEELERNPDLVLLTVDWCPITKEEALGLIQDRAYEGFRLQFDRVWYQGKHAIRFCGEYKI